MRPKRSWIYEALFTNLGNKSAALFMALVIWVYAFGNTETSELVNATLKVVPESGELAVIAATIAESKYRGTGEAFGGAVRITLRGPRTLLGDYLDRNPLPQGVLMVFESGKISLQQPGLFSLPNGIRLQECDPATVELTIDNVVNVERQIRHAITGAPALGMVLKGNGIRIEPRVTTIRGPESVLQGDQVRIFIEEISVEGLEEGRVFEEIPLVLQGAPAGIEVTFAEGAAQTARVEIELESTLVEGSARVEVLFAVGVSQALEITGDASLQVTCRGTPAAIEEWKGLVEKKIFRVIVPVTSITGKQVTVPPELFRWSEGSLPEGIASDSLRFEPRFVTYKAILVNQ
ncbi:MAG TPA: hypothetical protein EYN00_07795 [Planctomycetes bacterium]|nr:hypothetical protein [Planctomycetota bacterium]